MWSNIWNKFMCDNTRLQLKGTLNGGQSFRWKKHECSEFPEKDLWIGVFAGCLWKLVQETDHILYKVFDPNCSDEPETKKSKNNTENNKYDQLLHNYFRLDVDLDKYYKQWSEADPNFEIAAKEFYGIRILAQNPVENLFSFICSQNNHISRISSMIEKMCVLYGSKICEENEITYYSFPTVDSLAQKGVEESLRKAGFGYRAGYISKSASKIIELGGNKWIQELQEMKYPDAKQNLMKLTGVGAKVADCICLMSLGHLEAVPIDTHVYQIAKRCYLKHLKNQKTVTEKIYNEIGDHFRKLYGPLAGWAHTCQKYVNLLSECSLAKPNILDMAEMI